MSYFMTEDQKLIVQSVHEFCTSPSTQALVAEERGKFPRKCWKAAAEQGYIGALIPEEYGGQGYDFTTFFLIVEELTKCGSPITGALAAHYLGMLVILYWGNEEVKRKYLPGIASGDIILCGAMTDPAGSSSFDEYDVKEEKVDGGWKMTTRKVMVTNARNSDVKVILGRPLPGNDRSGIAYIIDGDTPGIEVAESETKLIPDGSDWGGISFNDVFVPDQNRLVDDGVGLNWLGTSLLLLSTNTMVMGQAAFKYAMNYCTQRTRYGKPIASIGSVGSRIADMVIRNELSRAIIYDAIRLWDEGRKEESYRLCLVAKAYVTETATQSLHDAAILHGGVGNTQAAGVGVMWVKALQMEIAEFPPDIHREWIMESYGVKPGWKYARD